MAKRSDSTEALPPGCCGMFVPPQPLSDMSSLSQLCKALGDPTRLQMLQLLAMANRPLCVCELESQFDLSQPTISHHLRILRDAGVVVATRKGTWVFYELHARSVALLCELPKLLHVRFRKTEPACKTHSETEHDQ